MVRVRVRVGIRVRVRARVRVRVQVRVRVRVRERDRVSGWGSVLLKHVLVHMNPNLPVRNEFPHLLRVRLG